MTRTRGKPTAAAALLAALAACTGSIDDPGTNLQRPGGVTAPWAPGSTASPASGGPSIGGPAGTAGNGLPANGAGAGTGGAGSVAPGGAAELRCETPAVGPSPLRRLTHTEYDNSVRDLLGDTTQPAREFAPDTAVGIFDNTASTQTVPELLADQYLESAVTLAQNANVGTLLGCDAAGASGATCVRGFIGRFGRRAFRRPLETAEIDRLFMLYDATRAASDATTGVRGVISAVLASPTFLFRPEFGAGASALADAQVAGPFELAARLASLIWASLPDDMLLDAAEAGQLATREQVATQARRMLDDSRAHTGMLDFYAQWFGLPLLQSATKDPAAYPEFNDALRGAMTEETRRFVENVLFEDDARLETLLTAPYSFVNAELAQLYGVSGPTSATSFTRVMQDENERRGFLTQASMLTAFASSSESSPVKRGKFVRVRILCQDLPDPPANIPDLPAPQEGVSTRERFAMHTSNVACSGCHGLIDGLGFGLEAYDGIGKFRTMDHGVEVDSSGEVTQTRDADGPYNGGPELALRLAESEQVRDCAPTQWLRFALGRREGADDTCSLVAMRDAFAASDGDLRELIVALTQTDAFMNYRAAE